MKSRVLAFLTGGLLVLTACRPVPLTELPSPSETLMVAHFTALPTQVQERVQLPSPTTIPDPTSSYTPTSTLEPSPTPTLELPVREGTPIPIPFIPISKDNVAQIQEIARWGAPIIREAVLSGDGSKLITTTSAEIVIYDALTQNVLAEIGNIPQLAGAIAVNQDGARILVITSQDVRVYTDDGNLMRSLYSFSEGTPEDWWFRPTGGISPDGKLAVVSYQVQQPNGIEDRFEVYQVETGEVIFSERGTNPTFSPDSKWLAIDFDRSVWFWDTSIWKRETNIFLDETWNTRHLFSPDGSLMAVSRAYQVEIWRIADRKMIRLIDGFTQDEYAPQIAFSPDSQLLGIWDTDRMASSWNIQIGERVNKIELNGYGGFKLENDGTPTFIQVAETGHNNLDMGFQTEFRFVGNNHLLAINNHWLPDWHYEACEYFLNGSYDCTTATGYEQEFVADQDGILYTITGAGTIEATLSKDGNLLAKLPLGQGWPLQLRNNLLINAWNSTRNLFQIDVLDISTGNNINYTTSEYPAKMLVSPDGEQLAFIIRKWNGRELLLLETNSLKTVYQYQNPSLHPALAFSPDMALLAFAEGDDQGLPQISLLALKSVQSVPGFEINSKFQISAITFSPDGELLLIAFSTGEIQMIDAANGELLHSWHSHQAEVINLAFSQDGTMLATSSRDGFIKVWGVTP